MITLSLVPSTEKQMLGNLIQLYLHDLSDYTADDVDEHGLYRYSYFDAYWEEDGRFPFLIRVDGRIAGLALVRTLASGPKPTYQLAEFFILRKYRRQGVGRAAAVALFGRFPGSWEIQQEAANLGGQTFWRRIISNYTEGNYREVQHETAEHRGPVQFFVSRGLS